MSRVTRDIVEHVPITRFGKTRKERLVVGTVHATCRMGRISLGTLKTAIRSEFKTTGRVVPAWRVQGLADELNTKRFAEALLDEPTDLPF